MLHERTPSELADHLDSLVRNQVYTGGSPTLVPLHVETVEEIISLLRRVRVDPPQVEKALNGRLGG